MSPLIVPWYFNKLAMAAFKYPVSRSEMATSSLYWIVSSPAMVRTKDRKSASVECRPLRWLLH